MLARAPILLLACTLAACTRTSENGDPPPAAEAEPTQRRGAPDFAVGRPEMPEPPAGTPFAGEDAEDAYGYPLQRPDKIALRSLLLAERFAELDAAFTAYQDAFEKDHRKEAWPLDAMESFNVADAELAPMLDAWVQASPKSFAAFAARGVHREGMGWGARGGDFIDKTSPEQIAEMQRLHALAVADLEQALALRPKLAAAHLALIRITRTSGDDAGMLSHLRLGLADCPLCFELRLSYAIALGPLWGGSHAQMDAFAKQAGAEAAANPKMAVLAGVSAWDRARALARDDRHAEAIAACDEALAAGEDAMFLVMKGRRLNKLDRWDDAIAVLDRALRLAPQSRDALHARAFARSHTEAFAAGAADLLAARQLDHTKDDTKSMLDWYLQKLRWEAQERSKAGKRGDAESLLALAARLAPGSAAVARQQGVMIASEESDALKKKLADAPDDFDMRLKLDLALAKQARFPEIVTMWDAFIADHPDHAKAYRERGGARWHARDHEGAIADMQRACDLGLAAACGDVPKMRARAPK